MQGDHVCFVFYRGLSNSSSHIAFSEVSNLQFPHTFCFLPNSSTVIAHHGQARSKGVIGVTVLTALFSCWPPLDQISPSGCRAGPANTAHTFSVSQQTTGVKPEAGVHVVVTDGLAL